MMEIKRICVIGAGIMGHGIAQLCATHGYEVNLVDMNEDILNSPEKLAEINTKIPWKRMGKPDDISKVATFLASDDADYITGATICIDGGLSLA